MAQVIAQVTPPRPLSEDDERSQFDCGRESLNAWFRRHAWHNHVSGISRTSVICDAGTGSIVGYVTLTAAQIEREYLAKAHQRNKPDPVPATLLGQLAAHKTYQGQGHARSLLLFALTAALRSSREVGSFGVLTHPVDEQVRQFYRRWGFEELPFDPKRSMIVRMVDLEKSSFVA
ncbi:MAG: GNAT family N-acetyltransferase [Xanthobacteraceae bacterium]